MTKRADQIAKGDVLLGGNSKPVRHVIIRDGEVYVMFEGGGWETRPAHQTVAILRPRKIAASDIRQGMSIDPRIFGSSVGPKSMRVAHAAQYQGDQLLVVGFENGTEDQVWLVLRSARQVILISEPEVKA